MSFVANTQSRALRVKCPMDGELSSERKKAVRLLRCRTRIPLSHDEDERKILFIIHTAKPVFLKQDVFAFVIIEGFLFRIQKYPPIS